MRKKTPVEMEKANIAKTTRTLVRLKHSLAADEEINTVLPDTISEFDKAVARGEVKSAAKRIAEALGD